MKTVIAFALLAFSLSASASVERTEDRFSGKTSVFLEEEFGAAKRSRRPSITFLTVLNKDGTAQRMLLSLSFVSDSWEYLKCSNVSMLIDGAPVALPEFDHDGTVGRGYVIEYLKVMTSTDLARKIADAQRSVELRVCNDEFVLPREVITSAKKFVSLVPAGEAPAPSTTSPPLDLSELERAAGIIQCNIDKTRAGASAADDCDGTFRAGVLSIKNSK
jgi:hypothetical protein